jgi:DNA-binding transcriptional LysR family regulator
MLNAHIDDIRTFVAVADARSVSGAARELHLTQSAVTRRVQRLEQALGAALVDRRHRPFALTPEGTAAVERCRRMLVVVADLRGVARGMATVAGEVRFGVAHALNQLTLVGPMDAVQRAWPAITWRLRTGWSQDLIARVQQGALDGACVLLPEGNGLPSAVRGERIALETLLVVSAPAAARRLRTLGDLRDATWVLNPEGCAARAQLERQLARARLPLRVAIETYDYELQMALVARGRGLGLVPRRLLQRSRARTRLATPRIAGLAFPFAIWMVTQDVDGRLTAPLAAVRDALTGKPDIASRGSNGRPVRRVSAVGVK